MSNEENKAFKAALETQDPTHKREHLTDQPGSVFRTRLEEYLQEAEGESREVYEVAPVEFGKISSIAPGVAVVDDSWDRHTTYFDLDLWELRNPEQQRNSESYQIFAREKYNIGILSDDGSDSKVRTVNDALKLATASLKPKDGSGLAPLESSVEK